MQIFFQGIREQRFSKAYMIYKKRDCYSYSLYAFEMFESVANTIIKLMSRVISEIIITRALGTRVTIFLISHSYSCANCSSCNIMQSLP